MFGKDEIKGKDVGSERVKCLNPSPSAASLRAAVLS